MLRITVSKQNLITGLLLILWLLVLITVFVITLVQSHATQNRRVPIYCVEREDKKIALTFNCAWGDETTDEVLSILEQHQIKATFFVVGEFAVKYPESVKKIAEAGHEIGNHSMHHTDPTTQSTDELSADISRCNQVLQEITGNMPVLYRAPSGVYSNSILQTAENCGMRTIQWSVDSIDWKNPTADAITQRVIKKTQSGSILLFHLGKENTLLALNGVIEQLSAKGYEPVTVGELLLSGHTGIRSDGTQIKTGEP